MFLFRDIRELGFDLRLGRQWDQQELSVSSREPRCVLVSRAGVSQEHGLSAGERWEIRVLLKCQDCEFRLVQNPPKVFLIGKTPC